MPSRGRNIQETPHDQPLRVAYSRDGQRWLFEFDEPSAAHMPRALAEIVAHHPRDFDDVDAAIVLQVVRQQCGSPQRLPSSSSPQND